MSQPRVSVLIPSFKRPEMLERCLRGLSEQTRVPDEVIVVWQADDTATRDALESFRAELRFRLVVLHLANAGIVPAENLALAEAQSDVVFLIDDDAVAQPDWVARHLAHYEDPAVGAVGGPADNFNVDGSPYPKRAVDEIGRLEWFGKATGNMYDHPEEWLSRSPREVDHLVGYNLSFRRSALVEFDSRLKPYWQQFELDACLQIKRAGYRVLFDFGIRVAHYPTSKAYDGSRDSGNELRNYNPAYNQAYILSKHSTGSARWVRLGYLVGIGSLGSPGLVGFLVAVGKFREPRREARIFANCLVAKLRGWQAGKRRLET